MVGCFVAVIGLVVGLALLPFVGTFISSYFTSIGYTFPTDFQLLEGVVGLLGFAFLILIAYAAVKSVRGG